MRSQTDVRKWALPVWLLSRLIPAGRLVGTSLALAATERRYVVESGHQPLVTMSMPYASTSRVRHRS